MPDYRFMGEPPKQSEGPLPGEKMVKNHAGGYVWPADGEKMLDRFLILGTSKNAYYANARKLTVEAFAEIDPLIALKPKTVRDRVVELSTGNRCLSNSPALFIAARMAASNAPLVSANGVSLIPVVCRTAAHLQELITYYRMYRKSSPRAMRRAISSWFNEADLKDMIYQALKYQKRSGQSLSGVVRSFHVAPKADRDVLVKWLLGRELPVDLPAEYYSQLAAVLKAKHPETTSAELCDLIVKHRLTREMVEGLPAFQAGERAAWSALAVGMPIHALLRNLGILTAKGALVGDVLKRLVEFSKRSYLEKVRMSPMEIFKVWRAYARGRGEKGSTVWRPSPEVLFLLQQMFEAAVSASAPFGVDVVIGVDVSGSMTSHVVGGDACVELAAAYAWSLARQVASGGNSAKVCFFETKVQDATDMCFSLSLAQFIDAAKAVRGWGTDCSLPFSYVEENGLKPGLMVVLTDNESWAGAHPAAVVSRMRKRLPNVRVVYSTMVADTAVLTAPGDPLSMDVTGFDATVADAISMFAKGEV